MAQTCEGCHGALSNTKERFVDRDTPDGPLLKDSRSGSVFGIIYPEDFIKGILSYEARVCQPCARAAIDTYTRHNSEVEELEDVGILLNRMCVCKHFQTDHTRGRCLAALNGKPCNCRKMRLAIATSDDDEDEGLCEDDKDYEEDDD